VTPFLAWLEALRNDPSSAPNVELHYCTRDREHDPFVARLEALCAALPSVRLAVHGARQDERITAQAVAGGGNGRDKTEVWFCGPQGLARSLKTGLQRLRNGGRLRFHQEAFEMR
jgi:predicted ferric reductase